MNEKIEKAFNTHTTAEFDAAYLYLSMSAWFDSQSLVGMASWMRLQAQEEQVHALKFYDFILERGGRVQLGTMPAPAAEWDSPLAAFENAYAHEQKVTGLIHDLVELSHAERDHAADVFLQWFVTEQVEEEATVQHIVDRLRMIGDNLPALLMMDSELGARSGGGESNA